MIIGEALAVLSVLSTFVPGVPLFVKELGVPIAVLIGALALLLVAVFDKFDPTRPIILVGTDPNPPKGWPNKSIYLRREE